MNEVPEKIEISGLPVGTLRTLETLGRMPGKSAEEYARTLIESELLSQQSFDDMLQPVREQFAASGMMDEELDQLVDEERHMIWEAGLLGMIASLKIVLIAPASSSRGLLREEVTNMCMPMTMIEVDQKSDTLQEKAKAMGLTLDALLTPLTEEVTSAPQSPRNEAMLAALQRSAARMKDVPVRGSTEETLKLIRAARGGEMWGYEPTE